MRRLFSLPLLFLLVACPATPAPNVAPKAVAGADQSVALSATVQLDASASSDPDGDALSYAWALAKKPDGSGASLSGDTVRATFTPDMVGTFEVTVTVSDGELSASDSLLVSVSGPQNRAPRADAGLEQTVETGATVTLDASASSDPEKETLTYAWTLQALQGSAAALSDASSVTPSFTADVEGTYTASLTVSDGVNSASDTVTVTARAPNATNRPPVAEAGSSQVVQEGAFVTLDGSGSSDPDGDTLTYTWTWLTWPEQNSADAPALTGADTARPTFTADAPGGYTAELTVSDGSLSSQDRVSVEATSLQPTGTLFVSPNGDDANSGAEARPLRTLKRALELAAEGSVTRVSLGAGTYTQSADESFGYTLKQDLQIVGASQTDTVLELGGQAFLKLDGAKLILLDLSVTGGATVLNLDVNSELVMRDVRCITSDVCVSSLGGRVTAQDSVFVGKGAGRGVNVVFGEQVGGDVNLTGCDISGFEYGVSVFGAKLNLVDSVITDNVTGLNLYTVQDPRSAFVSGSTFSNNGTGIKTYRSLFEVQDSSVTYSATHGFDMKSVRPGSELKNVVVESSGLSNIKVVSGVLTMRGVTSEDAGRRSSGSALDNAGLYLSGNLRATAEDSTFGSNPNGVVVLGDADALLRRVTSSKATSHALYAETSGTVILEGGGYTQSSIGINVQGGTTLIASDGMTSSANDASGVWFAGKSLRLRGVTLENSGGNNLYLSDNSATLDLGTASEPGGNTFRNASGTDWAIRDVRSGGPGSPVLYLHGNTFVTTTGSETKPSGEGRVCGPGYRYKNARAGTQAAFLVLEGGVCAEF